MASVLTHIQVFFLRLLSNYSNGRHIPRTAPRPSFSIQIPSSRPSKPGQIELLFYTPKGYTKPSLTTTNTDASLYPLVLNFHGGGFTIGRPTDDSVFAAHVLRSGGLFVSVSYRLAPTYPFPTAQEDSLDALRWIWARGEKEYGVDVRKVVLLGWSAGANIALGVPLLMQMEEEEVKRRDGRIVADVGGPKVAGIVAFYPGTDRTTTLEEKAERHPIVRTKASLPPWLYALFDGTFYPPHIVSPSPSSPNPNPTSTPPYTRSHPLVSPSLSPPTLLSKAYPTRINIWTAEWDHAMFEGDEFRELLRGLGKEVSGTMVEGVPHAWDKMGLEKERTEEVYVSTMKEIEGMWNVEHEDH